MSEYDAYLSLIIMLGLIISSPFFYRACYLLGKLFIVKFLPPKFIVLEVKRIDGSIEVTKVPLVGNEELVGALLASTGKRWMK